MMAGLATVMVNEVAYALQRHGVERIVEAS